MSETRRLCAVCPDDDDRQELVRLPYMTLGPEAHNRQGPSEQRYHWFCPKCDGNALLIAEKRVGNQ